MRLVARGSPLPPAVRHLKRVLPPDTREAWDRIAVGYDKTNTETQIWVAGEALMYAKLQPGMRFIDVACGSGALAVPAARIGAEVFAVDQSPAMLQLLRDRAQKEALAIDTKLDRRRPIDVGRDEDRAIGRVDEADGLDHRARFPARQALELLEAEAVQVSQRGNLPQSARQQGAIELIRRLAPFETFGLKLCDDAAPKTSH